MNTARIKILLFALFSLSLPAGIRCENPAADLKLFGAAMSGHMPTAEEALKEGANPDHINPGARQSPLLAAVEAANYFMAAFLLDRGALPDANIHLLPHSPLIAAILLENKEIAQLLLEHGAAANAADTFFIPLTAAISVGNVELISLLLSCGANLDHVHKGRNVLTFSLYSYANNNFIRVSNCLLGEKLNTLAPYTPEWDVVRYLQALSAQAQSGDDHQVLAQDFPGLVAKLNVNIQDLYRRIHEKIQRIIQTMLRQEVTPDTAPTLTKERAVQYLDLSTRVPGCEELTLLLIYSNLQYTVPESAEYQALIYLLLLSNTMPTESNTGQLLEINFQECLAQLPAELRALYADIATLFGYTGPQLEHDRIISFLNMKNLRELSDPERGMVHYLLYLAYTNMQEQIEGLAENLRENPAFSFEKTLEMLPLRVRVLYEQIHDRVLLVAQGVYGPQPQMPELKLEEQD
jgi:hypothetical protein